MKNIVSDNRINQKLNASFEHPELVWDEDLVWNQIEHKSKKKTKVIYLWMGMAASISILIGFTVFYQSRTKPQVSQFINNNHDLPVKINNKPFISQQNNNVKLNSKKIKHHKKILLSNELPVIVQESIIKNQVVEPKKEKIETESFTNLNPNTTEVILVEKPIEDKASEEKLIVKPQTITLNIPMDDTRPKRKKRVIGRFFQQMGQLATTGKFNWEEINMRPKNLLAYLKNSFVEEPDSTNSK
jgi:hypothetical protein